MKGEWSELLGKKRLALPQGSTMHVLPSFAIWPGCLFVDPVARGSAVHAWNASPSRTVSVLSVVWSKTEALIAQCVKADVLHAEPELTADGTSAW